jgi:hypothetical protein
MGKEIEQLLFEKDMPEYVKDETGFIFSPFDATEDIFGIKGRTGWRYKSKCTPVTKEEYEQQIKNKSNE